MKNDHQYKRRTERPLTPTGRKVRLLWGILNAMALLALLTWLILPHPQWHPAWLLAPILLFGIYDGIRAWRCGVCRLRAMGVNTPI